MTSTRDMIQRLLTKADLPVTMAVNEWRANGSPITEEALEKIIDLMRRDFLSDFRADGSGRFRPSMLGDTCDRRQMLSYLGYPKSEWEDPKFMESGTWGHYRWQLAGLSAGWLESVEAPVSHPLYPMKGSADGIQIDDNGVFELKQTNDKLIAQVRKTEQPKAQHLIQVAGYMQARNIEKASVVYESRGFLNFHEVRVYRTREVDMKFTLHMEHMMEFVRDRRMPEMLADCRRQVGNDYRNCPWKGVCATAEWREV